MNFRQLFVAFAALLSTCVGASASHTTTGNAAYLGDFHDSGTFDEVTLDRADWYLFNLVADQPVEFTISRGDVGNLFPNASVFNGVAEAGQTPGEAGLTELFLPPITNANATAFSITGGFTPSITGQYTLIVTTWTGQTGTYDVSYSGFAPESSSVPEPGSATLIGLAATSLVARRRRK